jgi:metal-dependent amidase/aminoacylase/carboxypeptidase family protein
MPPTSSLLVERATPLCGAPHDVSRFGRDSSSHARLRSRRSYGALVRHRRAYGDESPTWLLAAIERVAKGEALAGGAPREPLVRVAPAANATYTDRQLTMRLASALRNTLGQPNVVEIPPKMVFEDFSEFSLAGVPPVLFAVGGVESAKHNSRARYCWDCIPCYGRPDREPTLKMAITVEATALLELLGR